MKKIFVALLVLLSFNPCFAKPKAEKNKANVVVAQNKGRGLRITVPAPRTKGLTEADDWAAQVVQDLMTQGLSEYTEMTVIDRANESLVIEEQKRSERGEYSDSDYLEMGKITQAQYLLVGSILNAGGVYRLSLSVNDGTTNEIKASFNESVTLDDIQSGKATNAALLKLITAMNFDLTESEKERLSKTPVAASNTVNLAKGMAAEARSNTIEALSYYANSNADEAAIRYDKITTAVKTGNIALDVKNDIDERAAWVKLYAQMSDYVRQNLLKVVYDTKAGEYTTDYKTETVSIPFNFSYRVNPLARELYKKVDAGLDATGKRKQWDTGKDFEDIVYKFPKYEITFVLKNSDGKTLATKKIVIDGILDDIWRFDQTKYGRLEFSGIAYKDVTDSLSLGVSEVRAMYDEQEWRGGTLYEEHRELKNLPLEVIALGVMSGNTLNVDVNEASEAIRGLKTDAKVALFGDICEENLKAVQEAVSESNVSIELDLSNLKDWHKNLGGNALKEIKVSAVLDGMKFGDESKPCASLVSVTFPNTIDKYFYFYSKFSNCTNLLSVNIVSGNEYYESIGGIVYSKPKYYDFGGARIEYVPPAIETAVIADGVKVIRGFSFAHCKKLKTITIPKSVLEIGDCAFRDCENLSRVNFGGSKYQWDLIKISKKKKGNQYLIDAAKQSQADFIGSVK